MKSGRKVEITDRKPAARFRGNANNGNCSPRILNANNTVSNANRNNAGSAKVGNKILDDPFLSVARSAEESIRQAYKGVLFLVRYWNKEIRSGQTSDRFNAQTCLGVELLTKSV